MSNEIDLTICGILGYVRHPHQNLVLTRLRHGYQFFDQSCSVVGVDPNNQGFAKDWD
jgi:hypothetical protein